MSNTMPLIAANDNLDQSVRLDRSVREMEETVRNFMENALKFKKKMSDLDYVMAQMERNMKGYSGNLDDISDGLEHHQHLSEKLTEILDR